MWQEYVVMYVLIHMLYVAGISRDVCYISYVIYHMLYMAGISRVVCYISYVIRGRNKS
jgi:hypothetical protein